MQRKVTQDDISEWERLKDEGYSYAEIGKKTGRNKATVWKYLRQGRFFDDQEEEKEQKLKKTRINYSEIFHLLDEGMSLVDLVKMGYGEPSEIKIAAKEYAELKGHKLISDKEISDRETHAYLNGLHIGKESVENQISIHT